jgi:hypothetical protein
MIIDAAPQLLHGAAALDVFYTSVKWWREVIGKCMDNIVELRFQVAVN